MDWLIFSVVCVLGGAAFGMFLRMVAPKEASTFQKIGPKQYIINGEYTDLETNTDVTRMQQEMEDRRRYHNYEVQRTTWDREDISDEWLAFNDFERRHPKELPCIPKEDLDAPHVKYEQYKKMCDKLESEPMCLTKEQFIQKERCGSALIYNMPRLRLLRPMYGYTIHNDKVAKYADGNMSKMIAEEFKEKWY